MNKRGAVQAVSKGLAAFVVATGVLSPAHAEEEPVRSLFPTGAPTLGRDRFSMRLGYTSIFIKTRSGDVKDVTGPVVTRQELLDAAALGASISLADPDNPLSDHFNGIVYNTIRPILIEQAMDVVGVTGLGTPPGIKSKAGNTGTATVSLSYWLDEASQWAVEGFVLAAPLEVTATGAGLNASGKPNGLSGKSVVTTKLLPPLAVLSRYFGPAQARIRPYLGVGATYAVFFDARASDVLNDFTGGKTSVQIKNAFGAGPFVGAKGDLGGGWQLNLSVGRIDLKTTATLTTRNTTIRTGQGVLNDYDPLIVKAIQTGEGFWALKNGDLGTGLTTNLMTLVARNRGQSDLGTYVRKQDLKLTNTIVTLSVGRDF